ncbi:MAG: transglycosylase SLT domain-containing protein [Rhodospirillaceae bacterium]
MRKFIAAAVVAATLVGGMPRPTQAYLDADAAYGLALAHHHPAGAEPTNYSVALLLYCRADADGHANSAYAIGLLYAAGHGVKKNEARAHAWFLRAAELGHPEGRNMAKIFAPRGRRSTALCPYGWGRTERAELYAPAEIRAMVERMAPEYSLDPKLVLAVIQIESAYQSNAVSSANAQGLMQLIPATALRFGVRDPFDPMDNIRGGMGYLKWLLRRFDGDVVKSVAAYNAGEGAVDRYGGVPPYRETQNYVRKIRQVYDRSVHPVP